MIPKLFKKKKSINHHRLNLQNISKFLNIVMKIIYKFQNLLHLDPKTIHIFRTKFPKLHNSNLKIHQMTPFYFCPNCQFLEPLWKANKEWEPIRFLTIEIIFPTSKIRILVDLGCKIQYYNKIIEFYHSLKENYNKHK